MRKVQGLAGIAWKLGVLCLLCIPWSLQAENPVKKSPDHALSSGGDADKANSDSEAEDLKIEPNPLVAKFQEKISAMGDRGLLEFISQLSEMATLNPESFDALIDGLPALAEPAAKDEELKKELKAEFRAKASELGANAKEPLLKVAKEVAEGRFQKSNGQPAQNPAEFQKILDAKLAELKKKDGDEKGALEKKLEEATKKAQEDLAKNANLSQNPNDLGLDPAALAGLNKGDQGAADPGAGSGDPGGGSPAGGSPSGGGKSGGDKSSADKSKPEKKSNNAYNPSPESSKPEESKPAARNEDTSTPRAKRSVSNEDQVDKKGPDASGAGNANPILPNATPAKSAPAKLGQLGPRSSLPSLPADTASGAVGGATGPSGGTGSGGGAPIVNGSNGSGYGVSGGSGPTISPVNNGASGDQKFEYARDPRWGAANGGETNEIYSGPDDGAVDFSPAVGTVGGTIVNATRVRPRGVTVEEPAFRGAIDQIVRSLCQGKLDCNRTKKEPTKESRI